MAIRGGEGSSAAAPARRTRRGRRRSQKPGLFLRTIIPRGAVTSSISCNLIRPPSPPHSPSGDRSQTPRAPQQLVVASGASLKLHTLDEGTGALRELTVLHLFAAVRDLRAMPSPTPGRDVLVVLTGQNQVFFVQYEETTARLRVAGTVRVLPLGPALSESRLVATHPHKKICAVSSLSSTVVVFPVLFLNRTASAGKLVHVAIDGVILAVDFLEDEDGLPSDAILLVLVQRGGEQWIAVYTVGTEPGTSLGSGGLSVTHVGSMITCSERPDEAAVARHAAKLGAELRAPAQAVGLARIPRSPYLFAVFLEDRVVAADARPVIVGAVETRDALPVSVRVRTERSPVHFPSRWALRTPSEGEPGSLPAQGDGAALAVPFFSDADHAAGNAPVPLGMIAGASRASRTSAQRRGLGSALGDSSRADPYLSYLYVPSCVSLELGSGEGAPTAWTSACDHFSVPDAPVEDGMYITMESGALFVLRWGTNPRKGSYVIPAEERTRTGPRRNFCVEYAGHVGPSVSIAAMNRNLLYVANDCADGSLRRVQPPRLSSTPGTCARWAEKARVDSESLLTASSVAKVGYGLDVQQEFLNMSPVSDFIVIPPGGIEEGLALRSSAAFGHLRKTDSTSPNSGRPASGTQRWVKKGKSASAVPNLDDGEHGTEMKSTRSEPSMSNAADFASSPGQTRSPGSHFGDQDAKSASLSAEIVVCCGLQKSGTLRIVRPGAPVTVFSSSEKIFQGCNNMWSIRLSKRSRHDSIIALAFTQSTRILFSVPSFAMNGGNVASETISHLLDATVTTRIIADTRSQIVGRLDDGLLAQVHASGIRTMLFLKKSEMCHPLKTENGEMRSPLVKYYWDWAVPDGHTITKAAIGAKMVFISVVRNQDRCPCLVILRQQSLDKSSGGLTVVSELELNDELSCISVADWPGMYYEGCGTETGPPTFPAIVIIGTYAPSLEVWMLKPDLEMVCVGMSKIAPWTRMSAAKVFQEQLKDDGEHPEETRRTAWRGKGSRKRARRSRACSSGRKEEEDGDHWLDAFSKPLREKENYPQKAISSSVMTGVPESICAFEINDQQWIFVGLRNGTILRYSLGETRDDQEIPPDSNSDQGLQLVSRHRIGDVPITLHRVFATSGFAMIAQAERPWITSTETAELKWFPLAFTETRAWCSYSVPGAERCMATVSADDSMHICSLRRLTPVSVSSILVGDTPRRVLALKSPANSLLVATCKEPTPSVESDRMNLRMSESREDALDGLEAALPYSELKVFHKLTRKLMGKCRLKSNELIHVLLHWGPFIVVGTSLHLRSARPPSKVGRCEKGRLLLYSVSSYTVNIDGTHSERAAIEPLSEIVMPGAVLAGTVYAPQDMLVVSADEKIVVFGKYKDAIFEVAQLPTRSTIVSISKQGPTLCVANIRDSIAFLRLNWSTSGLVFDRTDSQGRAVADALLVDARTAICTDKFGDLFSLAYRDGERASILDYVGEPIVSLMPKTVREELCPEGSTDGSKGNTPVSTTRSSPEGAGSDAGALLNGEEYDENESQEVIEENESHGTPGPSNDGETDAGVSNAGNSAMNDVLYDGSAADSSESGTDDDDEFDDMDESVTDMISDLDDNELEPQGDGPFVEPLVGMAALPGAGHIGGAVGIHPLQHMVVWRRPTARHRVMWNLQSHHSFGLQDAALRVRCGIFRRPEAVAKHGASAEKARRGAFWKDRDRAVFAATLGGALVAGVPIDGSTVSMLSDIGEALAGMSNGGQPVKREQNKGVIDGDALEMFLALPPRSKREVAARAGFIGDMAVLRIDAILGDLMQRVG